MKSDGNRKILLLLLPALLCMSAAWTYGQGFQAGLYLVQFTDKEGSNHQLSHPETFLSQRAIDRRNRQNIPLSYTDLPPSEEYIERVQNTGIQILYTSRWMNSLLVYLPGNGQKQLLDQLSFVSKTRLLEPRESLFKSTAGKRRRTEKYETYSTSLSNTFFWEVSQLDGSSLHDLGFKGAGMQIAILDGGFLNAAEMESVKHLYSSGRLLGTYDYVNRMENVYHTSAHGSAVWSLMGGENEQTIEGSAPEASYWLLITEDDYSEYPVEEFYWLVAAEFADSAGVDVINTSLGYSEFDDSSLSYTPGELDGNTSLITRATDLAAGKGILVVTSAGNARDNPWYYITPPADADSVLTVGAVDRDGRIARFSSAGPTADLRVKPEVCGPGRNVLVESAPEYYVQANGTSFSSPIVCGLAACLWQAFPDKKNMDIIAAISQSANQYSNPDYLYGYGIPSFSKAYQGLSAPSSEETKARVTLFPNPSRSKVSLYFADEAPQEWGEIRITDGSGLLLYHSRQFLSSGLTLQIELPAGVYYLAVRSPKINQVLKMLRY